MTDRERTLGVILAGGRSRRMGGGDKALRSLGGQTLVARVAERLGLQCAAVILNANGDPARFAPVGLVVVPDDLPGAPGPLAGILAALDWAARQRPGLDCVVSAAADTPFLPGDLVMRLHRARHEAGMRIACAASGGRNHPVIALWPVDIRAELRRAIVVDGERRVGAWAAAQGMAEAVWPAEPFDPFFNVNTPADLVAAEAAAMDQTSVP